jgi:hypothetical protein
VMEDPDLSCPVSTSLSVGPGHRLKIIKKKIPLELTEAPLFSLASDGTAWKVTPVAGAWEREANARTRVGSGRQLYSRRSKTLRSTRAALYMHMRWIAWMDGYHVIGRSGRWA